MVTKHIPESLTAERADHNQDVWEIFGPKDSSLTGIPTKPLIARVTATYYGPGASEYYARRFAAAPAMLAALEKAEQGARQLCETVNNLSRQLGLGVKVREEDFAEPIRAAIRAAREGA